MITALVSGILVLLQFQNFCCQSASIGFERKNCGYSLGFLDKCIRLPVFIITGRCEDILAAKRAILADCEHFSPGMLVSGFGSRPVRRRVRHICRPWYRRIKCTVTLNHDSLCCRFASNFASSPPGPPTLWIPCKCCTHLCGTPWVFVSPEPMQALTIKSIHQDSSWCCCATATRCSMWPARATESRMWAAMSRAASPCAPAPPMTWSNPPHLWSLKTVS